MTFYYIKNKCKHYPLEGVPALEKAAAANARQILLDEIRAVRAGRPKP